MLTAFRAFRLRLAGLGAARGGGLAPIAAIVGTVMILSAGSAVDIGRAARMRSLLQDMADSAALAGAAQADPTTATNSAAAYVKAGVSSMTDRPTVQASYQAASPAVYAAPPDTGTPFTVALTATMPTSLMSIVVKSISINVSATATANTGKQITFTLNNYSSDAADHNVIYFYQYPTAQYAAGSTALYKFTPQLLAANAALDNKQSNGYVPGSKCNYSGTLTCTYTIGLDQSYGFALSNTTGTSQNCYGIQNGQTTIYYSHREDSSGQYHDYPTSGFSWCGYSVYNSSAGVIDNGITQNQNGVAANHYNECQQCVNYWQYYQSYWNTPYAGAANGSIGYIYAATASRNPLILSDTSQNCTGSGGVTYRWDDNGGGPDSGSTPYNFKTSLGDDDDHNDMVYTVACTKVVQPGSARLTG